MTEEAAGEETFISHLVELRDRLVKASFGIAIMTAALMLWPGPARIYDILAAPMIASLPAGSKMIATGVIAPFLVPMKVTLVLGFILALPWVFYQIWAFVAPGLYAHEKRLVLPLVISSSLLFMGGVHSATSSCSGACSNSSAHSRRPRLRSRPTSKTTSTSSCRCAWPSASPSKCRWWC